MTTRTLEANGRGRRLILGQTCCKVEGTECARSPVFTHPRGVLDLLGRLNIRRLGLHAAAAYICRLESCVGTRTMCSMDTRSKGVIDGRSGRSGNWTRKVVQTGMLSRIFALRTHADRIGMNAPFQASAGRTPPDRRPRPLGRVVGTGPQGRISRARPETANYHSAWWWITGAAA